MNIVAVDPGARRFAYAIFHDGVLVACGYETSAEGIVSRLGLREYIWVFETPRNYQDFAVAHKDLDRLRRTLARLRAEARSREQPIVEVFPSAWKGNVPKNIHHERLWGVLSADEKLVLPDRPSRHRDYAHDVHDAVGLGLTHLGRVRRGGRGG